MLKEVYGIVADVNELRGLKWPLFLLYNKIYMLNYIGK